MTYVGTTPFRADAGTIVTSLPVGSASAADPLPYWPSYISASPHQRACYLDWMAGGRSDTSVPVGYVFMFFNGLERRALVDREDRRACMGEILRLVEMYGGQSKSLAGYGRRLLAFLLLQNLRASDAAELDAGIGALASDEGSALAGVLAWHHDRQAPLPSRYAMLAAGEAEDAKRSVVLERAASEFAELFAARYSERYGAGLVLEAAKRPLKVEYQPASSSLAHAGFRPHLELTHVQGKSTQFRPLVEIWNGCIDDLRKLSSKRGEHGEGMTAEMWESLPDELQRETDHPDLDRWTDAIAKAPRAGAVHLVSARALAGLMPLAVGEKITAAQAKKLAQRAEILGFAVEPDARLVAKSLPADAPLAVWRPPRTALPEPGVYAAARNLLTLLLTIVMSDDDVDDRELDTVMTLVEDAFVLDDVMRQRLAALRETLLRMPASAAGIAKKIRETRTKDDIDKIARMLVDVAAADGVLAKGEHKALKQMFRALGLSSDDLDAALVRADLRLAEDEVVEVRGAQATEGEPIPARRAVALDPERIAALHQETEEVSRMLGEILDSDDDDAPEQASRPTIVAALPTNVDARWAGLELRYHAMIAELLTRARWAQADARALAKMHHLMPAGAVEAINAWAEDVHGDLLIDESDGWTINAGIAEKLRA